MDLFKVHAKIEVELTREDIDEIMCLALEGGIVYWCGRAEVVGEYLGDYASDQISRDGALILYDAESDDKWKLTRENFLNGVKLYLENSTRLCIDDGCLDIDTLDASDADCIIQYGLFGEIIFG